VEIIQQKITNLTKQMFVYCYYDSESYYSLLLCTQLFTQKFVFAVIRIM